MNSGPAPSTAVKDDGCLCCISATRGAQRDEIKVDAACHDLGQCLRAALERDMLRLDARCHQEPLGVEVGGEARAYPINMLSGPNREILNDTLGGRPIAATW